MPVKSFKFVSPGIFVNEIDNSQLPAVPDEVGPVIIGRTEKGPAMRPVRVTSFSDFVETFGRPIAGGGGGDVWRNGNYNAPTYAAYAAQAYLRNSNAVTVVRLLGAQHSDVVDGGAGEAGWKTSAVANARALGSNGGAYGLWVFPSGVAQVTGALAAIFYMNEGGITLSGSHRDGKSIKTGSACFIESTTDAGAGANEFVAVIKNASDTVTDKVTFNFNPASSKYIRKVFNTNPQKVNSNVNTNTKTYWLGQTFERHVEKYSTGSSAGQAYGVILGLDSGSSNAADFKGQAYQAARTPWIVSQDLTTNSGSYDVLGMQKLFRFYTLDAGERLQKTVKISIQDIKASTNEFDPYGSFTVVIRDSRDNDNAPVVLERFSSVNLNPASPNYIARRIGDEFLSWSDTTKSHRIYGNYANQSKYIRLDMNGDVEAGAVEAAFLPFGSYGPVRFRTFSYTSGTTAPASVWALGGSTTSTAATQQASASVFIDCGPGGASIGSYTAHTFAFTGSFVYPALPLRVSASDGDIADPQDAYFGIDTTRADSTAHEDSYADLVLGLPAGVDSYSVDSGLGREYSYLFSLDDVVSTGSGNAVYLSGSRKAGNSMTANSASYTEVLDQGFDRFTVPLYGGFNGLDITEKEPFNNTRMGTTEVGSYSFYSVKRAIDCVADPERVEYNLMAAPGIYKSGITSHMIDVCEQRGDSLAVIELDTGYVPQTENTNSISDNAGSVSTAVSNLNTRKLNSSYGCAYYPWVQIHDTLQDALIWAPPSVVALGTFSSAQRRSELWFAPAGFTRGGLTEGSAGIPVIAVKERLRSKDRDKLYEANINPIASFPSEGIVIFGQKTLQVTPSALDRINVRRLMIFVKKEISRIAATLLFDQNVETTWNRFLNKVNPFLNSIQARLGLEDFRVILDNTTTTPELVDRNIMYARIYLKPARAIEFIALDFVVTNSGASFED